MWAKQYQQGVSASQHSVQQVHTPDTPISAPPVDGQQISLEILPFAQAETVEMTTAQLNLHNKSKSGRCEQTNSIKKSTIP